MWPWAAVYAGQLAIGNLVWPIVYRGGFLGFLAGVVAFALFAVLTRALWNAREEFERPRPRLRDRYGEWALVTGASAGIGAELARALARDGVSCVLTARREDRLRELAAELERDHRVGTRVVAADLADPGAVDRIVAALEGIDLAILANNAGFGHVGRLDKLDPERLRKLIEVNCTAPVLLTHRLLPRLLARGRGAILITGSVAGRQPLPLHGIYAASKAFDQFFGEALWVELLATGVDVLVFEPAATATEFHDVAGEVPHGGAAPRDVVAAALEALGQQPSVVTDWYHWVRANGVRFFPRSIVALVARDVVAGHTPAELR
jgi:hypothetical protein